MSTIPPETSLPPTLTVTYYEQLAAQFTKALNEVTAILPPLGGNELANAAFVKGHLNVPRRFIDTAIAQVERNPELQSVQKLDVAAARDALQCIDAFRPVLDDVLAFVNRLTLMLQTRQAVVSVEALQIYDVAKSLARDLRSPELTTAVANLQRDLGRRGRRAVPASVRKDAKLAAAAAAASVIAAATSGGKAA